MQSRKLIAATSATMIIAFVVALMPFYLHFDFDAKRPRDLLVPDIRKMEAHATPAAVPGSMNFITAVAAEAGLTPGQFIATTVGMSTVATGYDITKGVGVSMADTAGDSLDNLIDAADYPAYDSLSSSEQEQWGSKQNYDAAKYNSFLNAFGLGEEQSTFFGSGGGSMDNPADYDGWSQVGKDRIAQIGRIGNLWLNGSRALFGDIKSALTDSEAVIAWIGSENYVANGEGVSGWPSALPTELPVGYGMGYQLRNTADRNYFNLVTNSDCYYLVMYNNNNAGEVVACSKNSFQYGYNYSSSSLPSTSNSVGSITYNGDRIYKVSMQGINLKGAANYSNMPTYRVGSLLSTSQVNTVLHTILYGNTTGAVEQIEGYPTDDIPDDEKIYFPDTGITPGITYNYFVTPTRTNNIYNPENQTGGQQWKDDTESNVLPLLNIQFDKLFPFCLLFDIQTLFDKVTSVTGSSETQAGYMTVSIPLDVPGFSQGETLDLNLQWLHDLLVTVRPFVQILLGAGLLFVTIRFWQGVLTG